MANELKEWLSGFKNSYIGVTLASTKAVRPVFISEVQPLVNKNIVVGKIITNGLKTKDWSLNFEELLKTFIWVPPTQSMLNLDGVACWLGFSSKRNTLKGWSVRHINLRLLNGDVVDYRTQVNCPFDDDLEIPYQVFSGDGFKFLSFQEALKSLDEGHRLSCAIAPRLALGNKKGIKPPLVYFEDKIIGVVEGRELVKLEAPFMRYKELFYKRWSVTCAELPEIKQEAINAEWQEYTSTQPFAFDAQVQAGFIQRNRANIAPDPRWYLAPPAAAAVTPANPGIAELQRVRNNLFRGVG